MGRHAEGWKLRPRKNSPFLYVLFTNPHTGKQVYESTRCRDKAAASEEAKRIYVKVVSGGEQRPAPRRGTGRGEEIEDLLAEYLVYLRDEKRRSPEWCDTIKIYWGAHWSPRWRILDHLTADGAIQKYISERLREKTNRGKRVSTNSVRKELSGINGFLKWCKKRGFIVEVPSWDTPEKDDSFEAVCLTLEEAQAILEHLPTREIHPKKMPVREWYTFMWATSFRLGTMARIRWDDVDWKNGVIWVRAKADKRKFERDVPLTPAALAVLDSMAPGVGLIFGKHNFRHILRKAAEKVGISPEKVARITANNTYRHSRLTDLGERTTNLVALQWMAGHKLLETTQKYLHGRRKAAENMLRDIGDGVAVDGLQDTEEGQEDLPEATAKLTKTSK